MDIRQIDDQHKLDFRELLLLADEQEDMFLKYLYRGEMFALYAGEPVATCVVTEEGAGIYELKSIAVKPQYQRMGYGKALITFIENRYRKTGKLLLVGTGDAPSTIGFYHSCGFVYSHTVKNFFTDHYDHPIIDEGKLLTDMIYLKKNL
ncbi:MAG TPA: GNAT family N-acetyltransferase [Candidatus Limiplasma sp.]|nr:GNAT family N-acetyltransferase [Candidatus Limiplasma sp.]